MNKIGKRIAAAVLVGAVGVSAYVFITAGSSTAQIAADTELLKKTDLVSSISASGVIESGTTENVYSTQNYPIKEIFVEVGDTVKAGDVLAIIDMESVELDIEQAELNVTKSQNSVSQEQKSITEGIQTAQNSVTQSKISLEKQQLTYDNLKAGYENGTNAELVSASTSVDTAKQTIEKYQREADKKEKDYELNQSLFEAGAITEYDLNTSETAYDDAVYNLKEATAEYNRAVSNLERTKTKIKQDINQAKKDLENAKASYNSSATTLNQSKSKTATGSTDIESQKVSLKKLTDQMDKREIYAPIDGTVTQVNAVVGALPSGVLFEIQDMNDLYVNADVKEFDIHSVSLGQNAVIKTEGTKDMPIDGNVSFISPVPKDAQTGSTTNVKYETHVDVLNESTELRIGMNARTEIELEVKEGIFAVNYSSIVTGTDGEQVIYILEDGVVKEIPVTCGMETDTRIEIISSQLEEDMEIITNPTDFTPGTAVAGGGKSES